MSLDKVLEQSKQIQSLYSELNSKDGAPEWTVRDYAQGLSSDVGDLSKLLMMKNGLRQNSHDNLDEKIRHEVCDCFWSIILIADELGIDLETEFPKQMDELKERINKEKK